jgi:hypothetical protein
MLRPYKNGNETPSRTHLGARRAPYGMSTCLRNSKYEDQGISFTVSRINAG